MKGGEELASKRQRKKQQAKQNINKLKAIGINNKKEIKQLKNKPKEVDKVYKNEIRYERWRKQADILESLGMKRSSPQRTWGEKRFNEWLKNEEIKKKKVTKKKRNDDDNYLLIFWRDKTAEGYADTELIERYKYQYKYMDNEELLDRINHYLRLPKAQGAEIGTTLSVIVKGSQRKQYINFMTHFSEVSNQAADANDWILVYEGKAKRYHDLLLAVHAIIRLLYDASERSDFISTILEKMLPRINMTMARRLAKDINWRRF